MILETGPDLVNTPLTLRGQTIPNRVWMSPMCQYSARADGFPTDWHLVHYGSRAVGGAGLVMVESTAIAPDQRTTAADLGLWNEQQARTHRRLTRFIKDAGAVPAVQLQAAGRKSSHQVPWREKGQNSPVPASQGGWTPLAPSALAFGSLATPREMGQEDIDHLVEAFATAAQLAQTAGYDVVEIHAAHGYLLHQFLSPLTNLRTDEYGGSLENRMRLPLRVARAVRCSFDADKPVFVRITATDWIPGGIVTGEAAVFAAELAKAGIDLLDVTSGALEPGTAPPRKPGLNVDFCAELKVASALPVAPVGQIEDAEAAAAVLATADVDAVIIGRALLRDPYFPLRLDTPNPKEVWPSQYHRGL